MGPISAEIEIDVARQRAFSFVADLANRPAFTDHFVSDFHLTRVDSSGVGAGARFRFFAPPQAIWMETTITDVQGPVRIIERGRGGPVDRIPAETVWEFLDGPGPLSTVRVTYWTEPSHAVDRAKEILGAASVWYSRDWAAALRRLRDLLESERPPPPGSRVAGTSRHLTGVP